MASIWAATKAAGRAVRKGASKAVTKTIGYKTPSAPGPNSSIYRPTTAPVKKTSSRIKAIEPTSKPPPKPPRATTSNSFTTTAEIHQAPSGSHASNWKPPGATSATKPPGAISSPSTHPVYGINDHPIQGFDAADVARRARRDGSGLSDYNPFTNSRRGSLASVRSGNSSTGLITGTNKPVKQPKTLKSMMHKVKKETSKKMDRLTGKKSQKYEVMQEDIISKKLKDKDKGSSSFGKLFKKKNTIGNKFKNDGSVLDNASTVVKGASLGARALGVGKKVASTVGTGLAQALPYAAITASARASGTGGDVINNINYPDLPEQPIYPPKEEERDQRDRDFIYG